MLLHNLLKGAEGAAIFEAEEEEGGEGAPVILGGEGEGEIKAGAATIENDVPLLGGLGGRVTALIDQMGEEGDEDLIEDAGGAPSAVPTVAGLMRGITGRQAAPGSGGAELPKNGVEDGAGVQRRTTGPGMRRGDERLNGEPL